MARFYDKVGYSNPGELVDGVWTASITERVHKGDVLETIASSQEADKVNDDVRLQNRISIVADAFILENFSSIKYVMWMGTPWEAQTIRVERPRIIISLGGVYHGPLADTES
jgi:hypothetical protein